MRNMLSFKATCSLGEWGNSPTTVFKQGKPVSIGYISRMAFGYQFFKDGKPYGPEHKDWAEIVRFLETDKNL